MEAPRSADWAPASAGVTKEEGTAQGLAQERDNTPTHPAGRGWVPQSRDLGIPSEHAAGDPLGAAGHSAVFTLERRVRFLDHLALKGNVRAAAARVGVSHETAYRKRRQDADFAALWDAAMVHARAHAEAVLATRALDGVEVPVSYHGEVTAYEIHHDTRLLLAHLARLDRKVEEGGHAAARAGRFDELLAAYAGHAAPEGFAEAAEEALDWRERAGAPDLPPTREAYVVFRRGEAIGGKSPRKEAEAMEAAGKAAGAEWDAWHADALARVEAMLEGKPAEEGKPESPLPLAGGNPQSPLPLAGGVGGGPVSSRDPSDTPPFVIPAKAGTRRNGEPAGPPESPSGARDEIAPGNPVTSVNPPRRAERRGPGR